MTDPISDGQPTYSTGQVAAMLGMNPKTVQSWCRSGKLPSIRTPGGRFRVTAETLRRLMRGGSDN
jgi:putative resolvase